MRIQRLSTEFILESGSNMTVKLKPRRIGVSQKKEGSRQDKECFRERK